MQTERIEIATHNSGADNGHDPEWEFFLPDDEEVDPEPGDFWIDQQEEPQDEGLAAGWNRMACTDWDSAHL